MKRATDVRCVGIVFFFPQSARWLQMWEIIRTGGVSTGTSSTAREDSDWLQPRPGGPVGPQHPSCWPAVPGQAGTWFKEQNEHRAASTSSLPCSLVSGLILHNNLWFNYATWSDDCVCEPLCSSWRVWCGSAPETYSSVPITMAAILSGLLPAATPAITSPCPPPSHMVRNAHKEHSYTHSTHIRASVYVGGGSRAWCRVTDGCLMSHDCCDASCLSGEN